MAQPSRYSPEVRRRAVWMTFWCERPVGPREQEPFRRTFCTPDRIRKLGRPEATLWSLDSLGVRVRELQQTLTAGSRSGTGAHAHPASTPYWTTFELSAIDMKAESIGILDHVVANLL
jgi:hypothetical protein